jgi:hypothetical protein
MPIVRSAVRGIWPTIISWPVIAGTIITVSRSAVIRPVSAGGASSKPARGEAKRQSGADTPCFSRSGRSHAGLGKRADRHQSQFFSCVSPPSNNHAIRQSPTCWLLWNQTSSARSAICATRNSRIRRHGCRAVEDHAHRKRAAPSSRPSGSLNATGDWSQG